MPEGHLIHRFALDHERAFAGGAVRVASPQGRFDEGARRLNGRRLEGVEAYGKHLFYWWEGGEVLHVHLGMRGKFLSLRAGAPPLRQSRMRIEAGTRARTSSLRPPASSWGPKAGTASCAGSGPTRLRGDADPEVVRLAVFSSPRPIGVLLVDQAVMSGVGNVLRAEGLFAAGIHPTRRGDSLSEARFKSPWSELVGMMRRGMAEGRIITVRPPGPVERVPESEGRLRVQAGAVPEVRDTSRVMAAGPRDQPPIRPTLGRPGY